jgi:hypothetical protein
MLVMRNLRHRLLRRKFRFLPNLVPSHIDLVHSDYEIPRQHGSFISEVLSPNFFTTWFPTPGPAPTTIPSYQHLFKSSNNGDSMVRPIYKKKKKIVFPYLPHQG